MQYLKIKKNIWTHLSSPVFGRKIKRPTHRALKISNIKDCLISKPTHPESKTTIALNPSLEVRENYVLEYKQKFKKLIAKSANLVRANL